MIRGLHHDQGSPPRLGVSSVSGGLHRDPPHAVLSQTSPPEVREELTESEESEESVYSGLEDSGSDSSDPEEEEKEEEEEEDEDPGSASPPKTQAKGIPRKRKSLEDDSPSEGKEDLLPQNEYEDDSSDEEVGAAGMCGNLMWKRDKRD
ncbi:ribosome biogenesis protein bop1-B-like [Neopelma chrysocephalum]|uniref:ribosome biogenesis protein bop1-B-like n=1 Tax=Neopelma chrysocephalum TaxID=114329 RepID=UPI000FCD1A2F|nr:ribosome biogenesis protein bop1-B-like [Neopelma chrysocephalum]